MSPRPRIWPLALAALVATLTPSFALAFDDKPAPASYGSLPVPQQLTPLEQGVLRGLALNPATAPYNFATALKDDRLVLMGRVGTKRVHDIAIRTALAFTPSIDDQLVIDTAATLLATTPASPGVAPGAYPASAMPMSAFPPTYGVYGSGSGGVPYVYPQPLLGYWDEPFYGFQPPVISYPPWWRALSARRLAESAAANASAPAVASAPGIPTSVPVTPPSIPEADPGPIADSPLPPDTVEMTLDARGVAVLRGTVPTLEDRIAIGKKIAETAGVTDVVNLLNVAQPEATAEPNAAEDRPPPPPAPEPATEVPPDRGGTIDPIPPRRRRGRPGTGSRHPGPAGAGASPGPQQRQHPGERASGDRHSQWFSPQSL